MLSPCTRLSHLLSVSTHLNGSFPNRCLLMPNCSGSPCGMRGPAGGAQRAGSSQERHSRCADDTGSITHQERRRNYKTPNPHSPARARARTQAIASQRRGSTFPRTTPRCRRDTHTRRHTHTQRPHSPRHDRGAGHSPSPRPSGGKDPRVPDKG